jgi:uncharacterized RDD family membrane protein YckC
MVFTCRVSAQPIPGATLVSGEAVELDVRLARAGSRVVALLLDVAVQAAILVILLPLAVLGVQAAVPFSDAALVQGVVLVGVILVLVGYPVIFETLSGGRTLGKLALGLRVVRDDGGPIRFRHALTRSLVAVAVEWPGLVLPPFTWLASLTTMLAHPRGKRIGDLAAGTIVIHERTPASWGWVPGMPPALAGWASTLDLTALGDDLALAVRHFLARGHALAEPERSRLGQALAAEVAAVTTPPAPSGVPGWAYLAAVLAERHRRAAHRLARARAVTGRLWPELSGPMRRPQPAPRPATDIHRPGPGPGTQPFTGGPFTGGPRPVASGTAGTPAAWGTAGTPGAWDAAGTPDGVGPAWPTPQAAEPWPSHSWPEPPWRSPAGGEGAADWTGLRPPQVASALRPATPRDDG